MKLSREKLQKLVTEAMPGYELVSSDAGQGAPARDSLGGAADSRVSDDSPRAAEPTIEELERLFLGGGSTSAAVPSKPRLDGEVDSRPSSVATIREADGDDVEIVTVQPVRRSDPWDRSARPKAIVVHSRKGIVGGQG